MSTAQANSQDTTSIGVDPSADRRETARNVTSALAMRILRYPVLAIYAVVVPRLLGASDYGNFAFIIALLTLAIGFLDLGTVEAFGRFVPAYLEQGDNAKLGRLFSTFLVIRLAVILVVGLAVGAILLAWTTERHDLILWFVVYCALLAEQMANLLFAYLFGLNHVGRFFSRYLLQTLFRLVFILLLYPWLGFIGAVLAVLLSSLSVLWFGVYSIRTRSRLRLCRPRPSEFWPHLKFGAAMVVPTLLLFLQQQVGPILLKISSVPAAEIGFFDLANQGFLLVSGLVGTGLAAFIPISSRYETRGRSAQSFKWLLVFLRYTLPGTCILLAGFFSLGQPLITLMLGREYVPVYPLALLMLASSMVWALGQAGYVYSIVTVNARSYLLSMALSTVTFLAVARLLVRENGAFAVALATVAAGCVFSASMLVAYRSLASQILGIAGRLLFSSISWIPLVLYEGESFIVRAGLFFLGTGLFLAALWWFGLVSPQEIREMARFLRRTGKNRELIEGQSEPF